MTQQTVDGTGLVEGDLEQLTALLAAPPWTGAKLRLYQASFAPTKNSVAADFIAAEATFTGYVPATLTYSAIGLDGNGDVVAVSSRSYFQATDAASPNTIGGCWIDSAVTGPPATDTAIEFYEFTTPVNMNAALAFCAVLIGVMVPGSPGYAIVDS